MLAERGAVGGFLTEAPVEDAGHCLRQGVETRGGLFYGREVVKFASLADTEDRVPPPYCLHAWKSSWACAHWLR